LGAYVAPESIFLTESSWELKVKLNRFWSRALPLLLLAAGAAPAAVVVIIEQDGKYQFLNSDALLINNRDRLRVCSPEATYTPKQISQCTAQKLNQIPRMSRDFAKGELVLNSPAGAMLPVPEGSKEGGTAKALWGQAQLVGTVGNQKQGTPIPAGEILAILSGDEAGKLLADYLGEEKNFLGTTGAAGAMQLQGKLIEAALTALPQSAPLQDIRLRAEAALKASVDRVASGLVEPAQLDEARRRVAISQQVFPKDPAQQEIRKRFQALETQFQQTQSILSALAAGRQWDAYLTLYKDVQQYEFLFPKMQEGFLKALEASRDLHKQIAQARLNLKDCSGALTHLRVALRRDPSDLSSREQAETARVCLVRTPRAAKRSSALGAEAENAPAMRTYDFVTRFLQEDKIESAEKSLTQGLKLYPEFPPLLLAQARFLEAKTKYRESLLVLDKYDSLVSAQAQWDLGDKARRDIEFKILKGRDERTAKLNTMLKENRFGSAMNLVKEGLASDPDDQDLLFRAAILSLILRQPAEAKTFLTKHLEASQSLSASPARRKQAFVMLSDLEKSKAAAPGSGVPNWMSRTPLPEQVFYDPVSLAFHKRVERVITNQKQVTEFKWLSDKLEAVQMMGDEKPPRITAKVRFEYDSLSGAVARVFDGMKEEAPAPKPVAAVAAPPKAANLLFDDPNDKASQAAAAANNEKNLADIENPLSGAGLPVMLANHPRVNLMVVEKLTGAQLGYTVAGNRYFHPFNWDKPMAFRLSYDEQGRVKTAYPDTPGKPAAEIYEFLWDSRNLQQISIYGLLPNGTADTTKLLYRRSMSYSDGKLVNEKVTGGTGKPITIEYKYQGQQLVSAECSEDSTLDGRSRKVTFGAR
jgi:hypothetical protein